ncbi:MAG: hypothetical protein LBC17_01080 [Lactobacillaceae bacterium]|jgi:hypothetical protein|nr:hypothetical protein [Lactobacillaceae bacterium]
MTIKGKDFILLNINPKKPKQFKFPISLSNLNYVYGICSENKYQKIPIHQEYLSHIAVFINNLIYELPDTMFSEVDKQKFYINYHIAISAISRLRMMNRIVFKTSDLMLEIPKLYQFVEIVRDLLDALKVLVEKNNNEILEVKDIDKIFKRIIDIDTKYPLYALRNILSHAKLLKDKKLKNVKINLTSEDKFDFRNKIFGDIEEDGRYIYIQYFSPPTNQILSGERYLLKIEKSIILEAFSLYKKIIKKLENKIISTNIVLDDRLTSVAHLPESTFPEYIGTRIPYTAYLLMIHGIIGNVFYKYKEEKL